MQLISIQSVSIAFGGPSLLDKVSFEIQKGERISFLGRNGAGKSTLMKIIAGITTPDSGEVVCSSGVRIAYLPQEVLEHSDGTIYDVVAQGAGNVGKLLSEMHRATLTGVSNHELERLHQAVNDADGWEIQTSIEKVLSISGLDGNIEFNKLSGGMRRRVFLARALVLQPDLLLLDEPTNHLDIDSINWLESFILDSKLTVLFITHDRRLLKRLATRIIELDRGKLVDWSCGYDKFIERKEAVLSAEEKAWENFDKKLSQEEVWLRKGVKARRTRNEGRVLALIRMRQERSKRRERSGSVSMEISEAERSGTKVICAQNVLFNYAEKKVIRDFSTTIVRGDRVGIIGPNGCGKTTLINLLLGKLTPQSGSVEIGTNVQPIYFDQYRQELDPEKSVWENVAPDGRDTVFINGVAKHIVTYLRDFLFTSDRAKSPVKYLSGGERNRLLLARMFIKPSNLMILDEPTNDLDTETLELLEELLGTYNGTVIMVSHDREFINSIMTSTLVFEGDGIVKEYIGGYDDWERIKELKMKETVPVTSKLPKEKKQPVVKTTNKRTYREQQEFDSLTIQIEQLEKEQLEIHAQMADPQNYKKTDFAVDINKKASEIEEKLSSAYKRWEELFEKEPRA